MNEKNENLHQKNVYAMLAKKRDSMIRGKAKKNRKAGSVHQAIKANKKINININQNINITTNQKEIENKSRYTKKRTIDFKKKGARMKSCIFALDKGDISQKNNKLYLSSYYVDKNISKDFESSFKMDHLMVKPSDSKNIKKEQFLEFFVNDNIKNKEYNLKNNLITTTKYNIFTFIPKSLLFQFCRLSNVYFLFTAIIQSIPLISPLTSLTAIIPLIFVLGVSMIREAVEDLVRNNFDNLNNEEEVIVLRNDKFVTAMSKTLRYGEIILVYENKKIPADMILIDSGFSEGTCYVETSSLDGEKALKLKVANKYTQGFLSNDIKGNKGIEKFFQSGKYFFNGFIKINAPNIDLNYINGTFHAKFKKEGIYIEEDINLSTNEFLLKGSVLKNTNWIIGIVVYTGMNNKIILNSKKPRLKMSKVEKTLNYYLLLIFLFLIICCIESAIFHHAQFHRHENFYSNFIYLKESPDTESFIVFFTYFLLLNTMIPISLIVTTEIIKLIQSIFIKWDVLLYSKWRHCFCSAKSVSIIEELGDVNFIFSDKTGTLTKNQLQFKYCIIDKIFYEFKKNKAVELKNTDDSIKIEKKREHQIVMHKSSKIFNPKDFLIHINHDGKNDNDMSNSKILFNNNEDSSFIEDDENEKKNKYSDNKSIKNMNCLNRFNVKKKESTITVYKKEKKNSFSINKRSNLKNNNVDSSNISKSDISDSISNINSFKNNSQKKNNLMRLNENSSYSKSRNDSEESDNNKNEAITNNNTHIFFPEERRKKRNSTILEVKNEENESSSSSDKKIIPFGDAFFTTPENNPYIKQNTPKIFNYIDEFWKALALTNECIVKDDKGEIRYMGTSPDDLELVRAASKQGYKLIETTINTKCLSISGQIYSYEILKVLGFSSERKRMSIILKDQNGIILYIKGADSEISKRLSKKSLENENYEIISNGLIKFSKKGLRTLMVAYRKIRQEDYDSWVSRLHEDELNIQNKQKLIEILYDIIENNLTLIGGTVVEDKLQDKVPETIRELRSAGIKIWVLTGDKLDTAESIGHSCNLLSKEQKLFTLKVISGDDESVVKQDPYPEMIQFLIEFQKFIDGLVNKYNLDIKYTKRYQFEDQIDNNYFENHYNEDYYNYNIDQLSDMSQSNSQSGSSNSSYSIKPDIIDFETFMDLKEKNILEPFSIIIEAPILAGLFKDEEWTTNFLRIAYHSNTVICCRVSPSQKSQVIKKLKEYDKNAVTLAIGDGGNDVSMIMEANVGIGIYGEEGMSAAQASDFALGEFKLLKRLLFIHGRTNLYRISKMILYFFYKNFVFTLVQFYFSFLCLSSGQTIIDDWYITSYNLIFTAFPLGVSAITDSDIDLNDEKESKKNFALLYKENRDSYRIFSFSQFIIKLLKGIIISIFIIAFGSINVILFNGRTQNIWVISLKIYISTLIIVSSHLLITTNFISYILPLIIGITTFALFGVFLILNHYGLLLSFNSKASIFISFYSLNSYLCIFIICFFSIILDYTFRLINIYFRNDLSSKLMLERAKLQKRKSFFGMSSKTYTKLSKEKRQNSLTGEEKARSHLATHPNDKLKLNLNIPEKSPKSKNSNNKRTVTDHKNEFSLKLIKNINANNMEKQSESKSFKIN